MAYGQDVTGFTPPTAAGGGGGGGDASAANQATMIAALSELDLNTDQIEALAAALGTNTDQIEGLLGTTNTTLTTIDGRVDGLEGLIGTTNTKLDSVLVLLARPTIVPEAVVADETIATANWLWGYSVWNTFAGITEVTIHNGDAADDPVLPRFRLAENESVTIIFSERLPCPDGIHFEVAVGTIAGTVFYEV